MTRQILYPDSTSPFSKWINSLPHICGLTDIDGTHIIDRQIFAIVEHRTNYFRGTADDNRGWVALQTLASRWKLEAFTINSLEYPGLIDTRFLLWYGYNGHRSPPRPLAVFQTIRKSDQLPQFIEDQIKAMCKAAGIPYHSFPVDREGKPSEEGIRWLRSAKLIREP